MTNEAKIRITGDSRDATRAIAEVKGQINSLGERAKAQRKEIDGIATSLKGVFAASAVIAGATQLVHALKGVSEEYDQINKTAQRTGLGAKFLQVLQANAELADGSLEELAKGFGKLNRELHYGGSASFEEALSRINVTAEQLRNSNPQEVVQLVARGIAEIEDPALKSATAIALLGRNGASLIPTFDQLAENMVEVDGLSRAQIGQLEILNDWWTSLGRSIKLAAAEMLAFFAASPTSKFQTRIGEALVEAGYDEGLADRIASKMEPSAQPPGMRRKGSRTNQGRQERAAFEEQDFQNKLESAKALAEEEKSKKIAAKKAEEQAEADKARAEEADKVSKIEEQTAKIKRDAAFSALEAEEQLNFLAKERAEIVRKIAETTDQIAKSELERDLASKDSEIETLKRRTAEAGKKAGGASPADGGGGGGFTSLPREAPIDNTKTAEERAYDDFMAASMRDGQIADPGTARNLAKAAQQSRGRVDQRNARSIGRAPRPNPSLAAENLREDLFKNRVRDRVGNMNGARDLADSLFGRKEAPKPGDKDFTGPTLPEGWQNALPDGGVAPGKGSAGKDSSESKLDDILSELREIKNRVPSETT